MVKRNIADLLDKFNEVKRETFDKIKADFSSLLPDFPEGVESVAWVQYTDYFNDGDTCTFKVHSDLLEVNDEFIDDLEEGNEFEEFCYKNINGRYEKVPNPNANKTKIDFLKSFSNVLKGVPAEFMKDIFGDHAKVIVLKDKRVKVSSYEEHN